jgi:hypothetical protein
LCCSLLQHFQASLIYGVSSLISTSKINLWLIKILIQATIQTIVTGNNFLNFSMISRN